MNTLLNFVAEASDLQEIKTGYASLIFTGCFFLAVIVVTVWWIKRST